MKEWPKKGWEIGPGYVYDEFIPADLARELYEALNLIRHPAALRSATHRERSRELDIENAGRSGQINRALARYEREVGLPMCVCGHPKVQHSASGTLTGTCSKCNCPKYEEEAKE